MPNNLSAELRALARRFNSIYTGTDANVPECVKQYDKLVKHAAKLLKIKPEHFVTEISLALKRHPEYGYSKRVAGGQILWEQYLAMPLERVWEPTKHLTHFDGRRPEVVADALGLLAEELETTGIREGVAEQKLRRVRDIMAREIAGKTGVQRKGVIAAVVAAGICGTRQAEKYVDAVSHTLDVPWCRNPLNAQCGSAGTMCQYRLKYKPPAKRTI